MLRTQRVRHLSIVALGAAITLTAAACGGSGASASKVASLSSAPANSETASTTPKNTQDALLAYAACMRENGIDMAVPTFDANGNPAGGLFGPESGIDRQSDAFRTAQTACRSLLQGVT